MLIADEPSVVLLMAASKISIVAFDCTTVKTGSADGAYTVSMYIFAIVG